MTRGNKIDKDTNFAADINESLTANINHALRTPLNGVVGMMDLLTKTGLDKNQLKYAHIIRESTENLMLQLDNILELAKIDDGGLVVKCEACRLQDIIKTSLQPIIASAVKKEIPISVVYSHDLPEVIEIDSHKLQMILTNLFACTLKFSEFEKIVLKVTREQVGEKYKLRFTLEDSKVLYDALYGTIEQYQDMKGADLREFGEVTVSLLTIQQLLNALGANINFDHLKNCQEPPFHFELDYTKGVSDAPQTPFSILQDKRALILQDDLPEQNTLIQCLKLWGIDARTANDQDKIMDALSEASREGRDIDFLFIAREVEGKTLAALKEKVPHIVLMTAGTDLNKAWLSEFSAHLIPPLYPDELLSALSGLYDGSSEEERSLSEEASNLVSDVEYEAMPASVMIVEDDTTSRLYATELLEGFGCKVATAENGKHALIRLYKYSDYDVIFMDCMMPHMDGYTTTQKLREAGYTDIPIIALTANTLEKDREKCIAAGMTDYIAKPVREQDLHDMLKKYIKKAKIGG